MTNQLITHRLLIDYQLMSLISYVWYSFIHCKMQVRVTLFKLHSRSDIINTKATRMLNCSPMQQGQLVRHDNTHKMLPSVS